MKYLFVGLGNPGLEYEHTRHNIGFDVLNYLASNQKGTFATERYGEICKLSIKGRTLVLLKPNTFMNLSGTAVRYWLQKEKLDASSCLVITDDISLPVSTLRIRGKGSDGGHNGLKSIIETLGNSDFPRLRFGVGNDFPKGKQADFVLSKWPEKEQESVRLGIDRAANACIAFCTAGLDRTMNQYNGALPKPEQP
jgi:peptidyl-tRNA hydrolase, PTH1 family